MRNRLVLDQHPVAHLDLDAVDDPHAGEPDIRAGGHADGDIESLVLGRRGNLKLEVVILLGVHAGDIAGLPQHGQKVRQARLGDGAGIAGHVLARRIDHAAHARRRSAGVHPGAVPPGRRARIDHVEADRRRESRGQFVVAVDAGLRVVPLGGGGLRALTAVVVVLRIDVGEARQAAADLVGGRQSQEEQAARQLGRGHRGDLDQRVRVGRGLGHVTALVVELGGHVVAVAGAGAHDPPDRLVERGGRGRVTAAARVEDGGVGRHERRHVGRELVDRDRPIGLAGGGVNHVAVVGRDRRAQRVDDLPIAAARVPPLGVVLRSARERGVEPELGLELAGRAAEVACAAGVTGAVHLEIEAVGQAEAEAEQHLPAHLQPQAAVELRADADALERVELEAQVDPGVEQLLAEAEDDLERVGPTDVRGEHVPLLIHEHDTDVLRPGGRGHRVERAIHADRVILQQDVGVLGAEVLEHPLPHDVQEALTGAAHAVSHVEQPAGAPAEDAAHRPAQADRIAASERHRDLVEALERALHAADHDVELVEDHAGIADEVEQRLLRPEQIAGVFQLRGESKEHAAEIGGRKVQPFPPGGERDAVGVDRLVPRQQPRDRRLRRLHPPAGVEVAREVRHREVEARGVVLDETEDPALLGLGGARLRERARCEVLIDRHLDRDRAAESRAVVGHVAGGQLAGTGLDVEERRGRRAGRAGEGHDERAVLQLGHAVADVESGLRRKLELLPVDAEADRERRAVGEAAIGRAVVTVEEGLACREVIAHGKDTGGVDGHAERRLRLAVGDRVDALGQHAAELLVIRVEIHVERDRRGLARPVGEVDPIGLADRVVGDPEVGRGHAERRLEGPLQLLGRRGGQLAEGRDSPREARVELDQVAERLIQERQFRGVELLQIPFDRVEHAGSLGERRGDVRYAQARLVADLAEVGRRRQRHDRVVRVGHLLHGLGLDPAGDPCRGESEQVRGIDARGRGAGLLLSGRQRHVEVGDQVGEGGVAGGVRCQDGDGVGVGAADDRE